MEDYKLPNLDTQPTYLDSFNKTTQDSLQKIEDNQK